LKFVLNTAGERTIFAPHLHKGEKWHSQPTNQPTKAILQLSPDMSIPSVDGYNH